MFIASKGFLILVVDDQNGRPVLFGVRRAGLPLTTRLMKTWKEKNIRTVDTYQPRNESEREYLERYARKGKCEDQAE